MKPWEEDDTFLARWLSGELTEEERIAFEADPEYAQFVQLRDVSADLVMPDYEVEVELAKVKGKLASRPEGKVINLARRRFLAIAASIVVLLGAGLIYTFFFADSVVEIKAMAAQQIELPDGSEIRLQEGSWVRYNAGNWPDERIIELDGEAFFEVVKGNRFEVQLDIGKVVVLGTSFNVSNKTQKLEVVCYTGKVQVEAYASQTIIEAGQAVEVNTEGQTDQSEVYLSQPIWINNLASFSAAPMKQVLKMLEELYEIEVLGEMPNDISYSGQFPADDLEVALEQVFGPFDQPYEFDESTQTVTLTSP